MRLLLLRGVGDGQLVELGEQLLEVAALGAQAEVGGRLDDVARLTLSIAKVRPFIAAIDWRPTLLTDRADLRSLVSPKQKQLELFAA